MLLRLAWRNFWRQLHRFQVILTALMVGFAVLVVMIGVTSGMTQTLRVKAARYFSGDVAVFSFAPDRRIDHEAFIVQTLRETEGFQSLCRRTEYYGGDATLYFGGEAMRQRKLIGVDWTVEGARFAALDWAAGGPMEPGDTQGVLISQATADRLSLHEGDEVTVAFNTLAGQRNTLNLVVRGVFRDTSFFGYATYLDIHTLNNALGFPADAVTALGAQLVPGRSRREYGASLVAGLGRELPTYPLIENRGEKQNALDRSGDGKALGVMTLDANLAQIDDILNSLLTVTWLASGLFLSILMIGVGNTYLMIVFERTQEIGTLRALGMSRARLMALLLTEASLLGLGGVVFGSVLGALVLGGLQSLDFSDNTLALLFLSDGKLVPWLPPELVLGTAAALVIVTLMGAWVPARWAARLRPVDALREGDAT